MERHTLLCVDDDPGIRGLYEALLGNQGYEVIVAGGGCEALKLFHGRSKKIDAVIADYDMPEMNGAELAAELKRCDPGLPVIMISGCLPVLEEAPHFVDAAMEKGASIEEIVDQVEILLTSHRTAPAVVAGSAYLPVGSALAGVVATAGFFLAKFLR
jgi:DNA-binding NtrC family response regulator